MKKDETFFNVMEELEKIRGDANLLENKSIDELFDLVMNNMQDFVQEEFAKAYRYDVYLLLLVTMYQVN